MRTIIRVLAGALVALLLGCTSIPATSPDLPYYAWSLGFVAPTGMSVWVEAAEAEDTRGHLFPQLESGTASMGYDGDAAGWGDHVGLGSGREVTGAALPRRVYVRWQSLVEPQTYRVFLQIDERTRQLMRQSDPAPPNMNFPRGKRFPRRYLVLGLAPGGWVKGWVTSASGDPIEVLCTRAEVEPKGPNLGAYGGAYVKLNERTRTYLSTHSVPYGSWNCGK
jgi:hypothetical protein